MVWLLLDAGADPNKADNRGETPLHWAERHGQPNVVRQLLDGGAVYLDVDSKAPGRQSKFALCRIF